MIYPTRNDALNPTTLYILLAITGRASHAYGIIELVYQDSGGVVLLASGTVYITLKRLMARKLIDRYEVGDARGRISARYLISEKGRRRLEGELRRHERIVALMRYKMSGHLIGAA